MHATRWLLLCVGIDPLTGRGRSFPDSVTTLSQTLWNRFEAHGVTQGLSKIPACCCWASAFRSPFPISQLPDRRDKGKCKKYASPNPVGI
ncbi:uncharacterized protein B0H64DRAFT_382981 [Chaetomium fimeti]|uniref:Uncharacterized protein n=1 Tax=Chaetomium fimeti TaxID=1854472 RepID=A0AAE0LXP2_9PEZI|nr:hypothetical protein B0H64DRAFT_382981 [Chaetomium fimeti]